LLMGFCLSAGNQPRFVFAVYPYEHDDFTIRPSQAHKALLSIVLASVLPRYHRTVECCIAVGQVDVVLSLVGFAFPWVVRR